MIALAAIPVIGPALAFLTSPLGRFVAVGLIVGSAYVAGALKGHQIARGKCEAEALRSQLQAKQVDLDAANNAAAERERLLAEGDAARADDQQRISDYERRLKSNPACVLNDDDWRAVDGVRQPARRRSR